MEVSLIVFSNNLIYILVIEQCVFLCGKYIHIYVLFMNQFASKALCQTVIIT